MAAIAKALAWVLLCVASIAAQAATYTFRSDSFGWETAANVVTWDRTCTGYPGDDDKAVVTFTGGFTFTFAGTAYGSVRILSNGLLQFGADTGFFRNYGNTSLPAGNATAQAGCTAGATTNVMAAYWTDLDPSRAGSGNVTWEQKGSAPNRYVVVSWNSVYQYGSSTPYAFQVILFENGEFKYQYGNSNATGSAATIGVQVSSSDYTLYSYNSGYNANGSAVRWFIPSGAPVRVAEYRLDEYSYNGTVGEVIDSSGNGHNGVRVGNVATVATGQVCRALDVPANTNASTIAAVDTALDVDTGIGNTGTVSFWVRSNVVWSSATPAMLFDATTVATRPFYLMRSTGGLLRFALADSAGTALVATGPVLTFAAGAWVHVAATWRVAVGTGQTTLRLYVNGSQVAVAVGTTTGNLDASLASLFIGDNRSTATPSGATANSANGQLDEVRIYNFELSAAEIALDLVQTHTCAPPLHHVELRHGTGTGLTCTPSTLTLLACQDAACATPYTGGVTGTLTATGTGMVVNWPAGAAFSIPSGSSSVAWDFQQTTAGTTVLGTTGVAPSASNSGTCNFGSPSCTFTAADSGLLFDTPNHRSEASVPFTVTAVRKSDNSAACTPAFASLTKAVTFKCAYSNPASGTLPVRVGGAALNAANSSAAACDANGRAVSLAFNASGVASTTAQYADVGRLALTATYTGSGVDAGLVMTGTDTFVAAPYAFAVGSITAGNLTAGNAFSATVAATNYAGNTTPNFGREAAPESVSLGFVRAQPSGTGASNGSFSGSIGAFMAGMATASNLQWSEVGRGDVSAVLTSASYLASGMSAAGSSAGAVSCASEGGTCTLPTGATAFVVYGANGYVYTRSGMAGAVGCNNGVFGDPLLGIGKACTYFVTSGAAPGTAGAAGRFIPHHFDVAVTPTCSSFTYAGQPFGASITARNAANNTTVNYDGSSNTSPNFAKAVTLTDAPTLGVGSFGSTGAVAATLFSAGIANSSAPTYTFTSKLTAAQSLRVRATDADAVSSAGFAEGTTALRSGRLRISNTFGSEKAALAVPVQAQYWSGNTWVANSADSCTTVPAAAVVRAGYLDNKGAATTAWTSSASTIVISSGAGTLTWAAPSPSSTGSLDFALNLGGTTTDQSCLAAHPASTGGALPWLRSQNGACASGWAADPSARATFGIYAPETRKTIHVREIF